MATRTPRKNSQFSGAAAMFRKKEKDLAAVTKSNPLVSPRRSSAGKNGISAKMKKIDANPLSPPSFVSPGRGKVANEPRKSWGNTGILSPTPLVTNSPGKQTKTPTPKKWKISASAYNTNSPTPPSPHKFNNYYAEPDVKIQVKSNIKRSINARKQTRGSRRPPQEQSVPEHIRKAREREQRRMRAIEEKEYKSATLLQAVILGWYVRTVKYPKLRKAYAKRRRVILAVLTIQKTFRMYVQRKKFKNEIEYIRKRERTIKEIKRMQKKIEKLPKKTKQDIKDKKKQYEHRKKEMMNKASKHMKEEDEKIRKMKQSGEDMVKYMNDENDKVKDLISTIQREQRVLEKQFEVLTAKSEEISANFKSLQKWVDAKNASIKKNEASDQKCRFRYLPKYREDLAVRNKYCITEFRIKELYKMQLGKIVNEVESKCKDANLLKYVHKEMKACKKSLNEMPEQPLPKGLEHRLKY